MTLLSIGICCSYNVLFSRSSTDQSIDPLLLLSALSIERPENHILDDGHDRRRVQSRVNPCSGLRVQTAVIALDWQAWEVHQYLCPISDISVRFEGLIEVRT